MGLLILVRPQTKREKRPLSSVAATHARCHLWLGVHARFTVQSRRLLRRSPVPVAVDRFAIYCVVDFVFVVLVGFGFRVFSFWEVFSFVDLGVYGVWR